ncbi:hypothetical protein THRCLA_11907 [Thraustotheca clavata]|uniref:Uncharacterized protein n=1 Tax=Thraustotheca clavata TaxID=74557 RepID=A0A1V9Y5G2_9STRA|nr:hypothetical protein THRCLA_11907 [Thraustotheca clavata]
MKKSPYIVQAIALLKRSGIDTKINVTSLQVAWVLANSLDDLHGNQMMHRNLKSVNVLLSTEQYIKLGDFRTARELASTVTAKSGIHLWTGPELFESAFKHISILLVCLMQISSLMLDASSIVEQVRQGKLRSSVSATCDPRFLQLSEQYLAFNLSQRPTAEQIVRILQNEIRQKHNIKPDIYPSKEKIDLSNRQVKYLCTLEQYKTFDYDITALKSLRRSICDVIVQKNNESNTHRVYCSVLASANEQRTIDKKHRETIKEQSISTTLNKEIDWLKKRKAKAYKRVCKQCSHLKHLRMWFDSYDLDKSGGISAEELVWPMLVLGFANTLQEIEVLLKDADSDGDGQIGFDDFVELMNAQSVEKGIIHPMEKLVQIVESGALGDPTLSLQTLLPSYQRQLMLTALMSYGDSTRTSSQREMHEAMLRRANIALESSQELHAIPVALAKPLTKTPTSSLLEMEKSLEPEMAKKHILKQKSMVLSAPSTAIHND